MEKPRIRHIAINVEDLDKTAEYYKKVFGMEEKHRRPGGTIYLSDGHLDLALIHTEKYPWGINHFGFKVESVKEIEENCRDQSRGQHLRSHCGKLDQRRRRQSCRRFRTRLADLAAALRAVLRVTCGGSRVKVSGLALLGRQR